MARLFLLPLLLILSISFTSAQPKAGGLYGEIIRGDYHAPNGTYYITLPVLPELGATVSDTPSVVVFRDQFSIHISIGSFPHDASQRWELSSRGLQDYLSYYFINFVFPDFEQLFPGSRIESTTFEADVMGGALVVYSILPGGTMFAHRRINIDPENKEPDAKRGNLIFIRHGHVYVISVELAERVIEGSAYKLTTEQENSILRQRLEGVLENLFINRPRANP
jgi:hypothetical protein